MMSEAPACDCGRPVSGVHASDCPQYLWLRQTLHTWPTPPPGRIRRAWRRLTRRDLPA